MAKQAQPCKKILTVFPTELLDRLNAYSQVSGVNRSEFIRRASAHYLKLQEDMRMHSGYTEMAGINLHFAETAVPADNAQQANYEKKLVETEA